LSGRAGPRTRDVTLAELAGQRRHDEVDGMGSAVHAESINVGRRRRHPRGMATLKATNHGQIFVDTR